MNELNDKLINYGGLAYFYSKLQENDLAGKQTYLTAGDHIAIDANSYISAYGFLTEHQDLSAYATISYVNTEDANVKDLAYAYASAGLATKQDTLTAGANIEIVNNTISAYGFVFDKSKGSIAEQYFDDDNNVIATNTATGIGAHAEGYSNIASGDYGSHAEGYYTVANGESSHAEGSNTKTNNAGEHAEGFNNVSHNLDRYQTSHKTISSIGIGDSSTSKNGVEVMWSGDMYLYGVGGYDGVHIKHETGYSNVKTLQEVVNSKADAYETATTAEIEAMFS